MTVPESAVYKNSDLKTGPSEVWSPGGALVMDPPSADTGPKQSLSKGDLGLRVLALDGRHYSASLLLRARVRHLKGLVLRRPRSNLVCDRS